MLNQFLNMLWWSAVTRDTANATTKLIRAPTAPKALGEIPKNQSGFHISQECCTWNEEPAFVLEHV